MIEIFKGRDNRRREIYGSRKVPMRWLRIGPFALQYMFRIKCCGDPTLPRRAGRCSPCGSLPFRFASRAPRRASISIRDRCVEPSVPLDPENTSPAEAAQDGKYDELADFNGEDCAGHAASSAT